MTKSKIFEEQYPTIHHFVEEIGWIEIRQHKVISSFVRAYDEGGTVYEGKANYPSMAAAFQDLKAGIKAYLDKWGIYYQKRPPDIWVASSGEMLKIELRSPPSL